VPDVHTIVLVGKDLVTLSHDKAPKRPVAVANLKLTTTRVVEFL
jgi:hypothetical protein